MKYNKFILPLAACAFLFTGCVDEVMEWQDPDGTITEEDIPLLDNESLALYKSIKEYAAEYTPDMKIGLGLGADLYIEDAAYRAIADENFQMFTTGNAMKHSSVVKANGDLNFATIDAFMELVPEDVEVYGHNFLWHTQQKQQYLKSLIAPEMKVEVPQGEKCENVVTNGGFENGTNGWTGLWGKYTYAVEQPGRDGSGNAIHFTISPECANQWDAQLFWSLNGFLEPGVTYYYEFYAKSDSGLGCQFIGQNASYDGIYKDSFTPGIDWILFSGEFTYNEGDTADIERVGLQFGGEPGSQIWFDDFKFGKKMEEVEQEPMINIVGEAGTFEAGNTDAFGCWGNNSPVKALSEKGQGYESDYAMVLTNPEEGGEYQEWKAQCAYDLAEPLSSAKTYVVSFWAKSDVPGTVQFQFQNGTTYGSQGGYARFNTSSDWLYCEHEFQTTNGEEVYEDVNRLLINFGAYAATYYIDDFKFGEKNPEYGQTPDEPLNYCTNGSFESALEGNWKINNGAAEVVTLADAIDGKSVLKMVAPETAANAWDLQIVSPDMPVLPGKKINMSFWVKADQPGQGRISFTGLTNAYPWLPWTDPAGSWSEAFEVSTNWMQISINLFDYDNDFAEGSDVWSMNFDFGYMPGVTYYLDDVRITEIGAPALASARRIRAPKPQKAAPTITYIYKTPEEKKALLLGAMESWIKQMAEHLPTVKHWDVINEPIMDGSNAWRGIDNVFNGEDTAPVENEGLTLNWASDHWYWGYYIGKEYASKAFEYARQYCGPDAKLFVNDYNLETSPGKLQALIDFAKYIDENNSTGGPLVDGIGTQMHVQTSITKDKVDAMFKKMAETGKLVRVTELDVAVGTANPTAEQLIEQAETYKMIVESYKENVPAAQQSGITIWTLSDNAAEHEHWLNGDAPNLFDANYGRKLAYKYFCDGLAGKDISEEFTGSDWKDTIETEETEETEEETEGTEETLEE